jgi:CRISPR-associated DxTHG motif protein
VHYLIRDESGDVRSAEPETYVQAAILDHLRAKGPIEVRIGITAEARKAHGEKLRQRLARSGLTAREIDLDLDVDAARDGRSLWSIFEAIGAQFEPGDEVYFDITHGFRSLPIIALLALAFFSRARKFAVGGVYYGAFESLLNRPLPPPDGVTFGSPRDIQIWLDGGSDRAPRTLHAAAPVFDLTVMYSLTQWTEGVAQWEHIGRADALVAHARPLTDALRKALQKDTPKSLAAFPAALGDLSDALTSVRHDDFAGAANRVLKLIDQMSIDAQSHPALTPLRALDGTLKRSVEGLAVPFAPGKDWAGSQVTDDAYLRHQCAVAGWLRDRRRVVEAFTVLRETITSCVVRIALAADVPALGEKQPDDAKYRSAVDGWTLVWLRKQTEKAKGRPTSEEQPDACNRLCAHLEASPTLAARIRDAVDRVLTTRNRFDHAWTGREHSIVGRDKVKVDRAVGELDEAVKAVTALVDAVIAPAQEPSKPPSAGFMNLSNHPIADWSKEQTESARLLGFGDPAELPGGMPQVPPAATAAEVDRLAQELADRTTAQGALAAMVATEFSLTVALVRALQGRGVRCFTATTERGKREFIRDHDRVKESVFRFMGWREYSA